ncbi:MAG: hypothetical protein SPI58_03745 [Candidatus Enteromonas sp.]|nr:hypothetical protein [Candidatus Enteromonas sp.]
MDFKYFTSMLGDFVLGLQVLRSNLTTFSKIQGNSLGDYLEFVQTTMNPQNVKEFQKLMMEEKYFLFDVGLSFMDKEHFASTPEFESACDKLTDARKRLYGFNGELIHSRRG